MGYSRENSSDVIFFMGTESNSTPAYGIKTLFVVGYRDIDQILTNARENGCKHIYLGANDSFQKNKLWNVVISTLLNSGYKVTLDFPLELHSYVIDLLDNNVFSDKRFIPIIGCKIKKVETLSDNLVIKIDDENFNYSNSGIWCLPKNDLLDCNRYTSWDDYGNDVNLVKKETTSKSNRSKK